MATNLRPYLLRLCLWLALLTPTLGSLPAAPVTSHPRILFRASDLPALRARMSDSNDVWVAFRDQVVVKALRDWKSSATYELRMHDNWTPNNPADDYLAPVRVTFTDHNGVLHKEGDADWKTTLAGQNDGSWFYQADHPAAPEDDIGAHTGGQPLISEQYAMIFAFMALMTKDDPAQTAQHAEYVTAAKECLFTVINPASLGHPAPDANGKYPAFRHPGFALQDRSFAQEAFGLTVDWIYDEFTAEERAKIRKTFLLWAADAWTKPYYSPINPNNLVNDPAILGLNSEEQSVKRGNLRIALNNHYANHLRQMTLYALSFDPADDVPSSFASVADAAPVGALTSFAAGPGGASDWVYQNSGLLKNVTGSWLYLADYAQRHDGAGGLSLEGTQYFTNGLGPLALTLTALQTAGQDDVTRFGPQVSLEKSAFWSRTLSGFLAHFTPTPRVNSALTYLGSHYQPPLTGDMENYAMLNDQFIKILAPLAISDWQKNGTTGDVVQAVRYIQRQLAPGGPSRLEDRIRSTRSEHRYRDAIYYFLLFDPAAPAPADPRPALQPDTFWAGYDPAGTMGQVLARTGQTAQDTYFHWQLGWMRIDHQQGDNLGFGLWKNGLWLTKLMTGYGSLQGCSDYRNAPALQNNTPANDGSGLVAERVAHGSQLSYESMGDPHLIARSTAAQFLHFDGDATNLYNSYNRPEVRAVTHASRSLVWLKPDIVVVYDRSESQAGLWKRFYLNLPEVPTINGNIASAVAKEGQIAKAKIFVSSLLPAGATVASTDISSGKPSGNEDMQARLVVEAPGAPAAARFLHVVEGADASAAAPAATQLISSTSGTDYDGAVIGPRVVLFKRVATASVASLTYQVPASVAEHYITGLAPFTAYTATFGVAANGDTIVAIAPGGNLRYTDGGGVLLLGVNEPANVEIKASTTSAVEGAVTPVTFTVSRSGDATSALTVALGLSATAGTATAADISGLPWSVTIPAGAGSASFTVNVLADGVAEGAEDLVVALQPSAAFHIAEAGAAATVTLSETAPNVGTLQFTTSAITASETSGNLTLTVTRLGSTEGDVSVSYAATGGTATAGADYGNFGGTLTWVSGESAPKTITIPLVNDPDSETAETIVVKLLTPSQPGALGSPATLTVTIADDESGAGGGNNDGGGGNNNNGGGTPSIPGEGTLQFAATNVSFAEGNGAATLAVSRSGSSVGPVSVGYYTMSYSASHGTEYNYASGTLNWADGDSADKFITITLLDDATPEPAKYFKVALQSPGNGAVLGAAIEATVNIVDDDSAGNPPGGGDNGGGNNNGGGGNPPVNPGTLEFVAPSLTVSEADGVATLTVQRVGGSDGAVSVNYYTLSGSALPGADYGYAGGTLYWAAGDATPQTITIPLVNNVDEEPTETFQLTLDGPTGGATLGASALATITITDDEIVYHVGPGQPLSSLAQVPWKSLAPGTRVRLHWRATPYAEKVLLSVRGTAEAPVVFEGVPNEGGELPVIDGTGAAAAANIGYAPWYGDVMERSLVAVARGAGSPADFKPGHLVIANLELTMSGAKLPMPSYTKPDGSTATYYLSAGAIFLYGAEHVAIRDCIIHDTPNGIVAASGSSEATLPRDLTVERCWLYNAGKGGTYHGSNLMTEAIGLTVQFSRLDRGLNASNVANVIDRSAGGVFRYNTIIGGSNQLNLIEPVSAPALIVADPSYATTHVYGNIFRNGSGDSSTDGANVIRYGGDWSSSANFRAGTLHFHHNTVLVDSTRWQTNVLNLTLAGAQAAVSNNVLHHLKLSPWGGPFNVVNSGRTVALGRNWITAGYSVGGTASGGTAQVLTGASPGFVSLVGNDLRPAAGSPLLDAALALPAGALPVEFEYLPEADGQPRVTSGAAADLGALEKPN